MIGSKYLPGAPEFIPFTKELPKDTTSQKQKAAKEKGVAQAKVDGAAGAIDKVAEKMKEATV